MDAKDAMHLQSLTTLEILDRTFRLYREHFSRIFGLVTLILVPIAIVNQIVALGLTSNVTRAEAANRGFLLLGISFIFGIIRLLFLECPLIYMASEINLGRRPTLQQAYDAVGKRAFSVLGGVFRVWTTIGLFAFVYIVATALLRFLGLTLGLVIYYLLPLYAFLTPIVILEQVGVGQAIRRAGILGRSRFWALFLLATIMGTLSLIFSLGSTAAFNLINGQQTTQALTGIPLIIQFVINTVVSVALAPILPIGFTLYYYDARVRMEGLDFIQAALEKPDFRPNDVPSPHVIGSITSRDTTNLAYLTGLVVLGAIGLVVLTLAGRR
jgi:hypothetical protein